MNEKNRAALYFMKYSKTVNAFFLVDFLLLTFLFCFLQIPQLAVMNFITFLFFLSLFFTSYKIHHLLIYMTYLAVILNSSISILYLGWNYGFQLHYISLLISLYYYQYFQKKLVKNKVLSFISIIFYCVLCFYSYLKAPIIQISHEWLPVFCTCFQGLYIGCYIMYNMDITHRAVLQTELQLKEISERDELTKIYNRRKIQQLANNYFFEAKLNGTSFSVAIFDLDNFKKINDTYGHMAGDYILEKIAAEAVALKTQFIDIGRWGGEEFLVLSVGDQAFENLEDYMRKYNRLIYNHKFIYKDDPIKVSITAGLTSYINESNVNDIISRADRLLYEGKKNGKNCIVCK